MGPGPKGREERRVIAASDARDQQASMGPGPRGREELVSERYILEIFYLLQWGPALKAGRNCDTFSQRLPTTTCFNGARP